MLEQLRHILSSIIPAGTKLLRLLFPRMHLRALIRLNRQAFGRWRLRSRIAAHVRDHNKFVAKRYAAAGHARQKPLAPAEHATKGTQHLNLDRIIGQEVGRQASLAELNSFELNAVYRGVLYAMANFGAYGTTEPDTAVPVGAP